jgi:hypothetical protein
MSEQRLQRRIMANQQQVGCIDIHQQLQQLSEIRFINAGFDTNLRYPSCGGLDEILTSLPGPQRRRAQQQASAALTGG